MTKSQVPRYDAFTDEKNPYRARGFCGTISNGKTQSIRSEYIEDFTPFLKRAQIAWVDYIVEDFGKDAAKVAQKVGFSELLVKALLKNIRSGYEDFESEMGLLLPAIHVHGFDVALEPQLILIRKNLILTLHTRETTRFSHIRRYSETFMKKLKKSMKHNDKLTMVLIRIIDESNSKNFEHLQEIEESGDSLSHDLSDSRISRAIIGEKIYQMKHALIIYLSGLWATADALSSLRHGDALLITDDPRILDRISGLINEVHAQISLAEHLSDVLASGMEVLQSIYNNQLQILNNRLAMLVAYLTIIGTALLVPNTIATVMGNGMFHFTEMDEGWYIALILASTVVATVLSWWVVDRMGLLPKKPDAPEPSK
jgi:magnesium transporter